MLLLAGADDDGGRRAAAADAPRGQVPPHPRLPRAPPQPPAPRLAPVRWGGCMKGCGKGGREWGMGK
eukprot:356142-Rhodomonas_salina.1